MKRINVGLGDRSYEALIRRGLLTDKGVAGGAASLVRLALGGQIAFVSDENVWQACGRAFFETLKSAALADSVKTKVFSVILPPGEAGKNLESLGRIAAAFAEGGLTRGGLVCAMGGGVVGDLAGFAAATWMRGVRYIQIPTSLLAMVDSSVGGKTAVDIPAGKNLLGAFHQPSLVLVDSETLRTLPPREFRSGMAEVIKYGAICSEALFERLERMNKDGVYGTALEEVIADCIRIKAEIVAQDEFDKGRRAILNFGHTFGHAIEAKYGFAKYTHGEAVALGMRLAASYGEMAGTTAPGTAKRLGLLLDSWGLSEKERTDGLDDLIRRDKKAKGEAVELVLLKGIGEAGLFATGFLEIASRLEALRGV